jgi:hypothetical protein
MKVAKVVKVAKPALAPELAVDRASLWQGQRRLFAQAASQARGIS